MNNATLSQRTGPSVAVSYVSLASKEPTEQIEDEKPTTGEASSRASLSRASSSSLRLLFERRRRPPAPLQFLQQTNGNIVKKGSTSSKTSYEPLVDRGSMASYTSDAASTMEGIPIYVGGLPHHLNQRRDSPGIPVDATLEGSGYLNSPSASLYERLRNSHKLVRRSFSQLGVNDDLKRSKRDETRNRPSASPVKLSAATSSSSSSPLWSPETGTSEQECGRGTRTASTASFDPRWTSYRIVASGSSSPAVSSTWKRRASFNCAGISPTNTGDSSFTVSAYADLPSLTPSTGRVVPESAKQLAWKPKRHSRPAPLLCKTDGPDCESIEPASVSAGPCTASTLMETGLFLSQMEQYLARHLEAKHLDLPLIIPTTPSLGLAQIVVQQDVQTTRPRLEGCETMRIRIRSASNDGPVSAIQSIDPTTCINLIIDQVSETRQPVDMSQV